MKYTILALLILAGCKEKEPTMHQYIIECKYGLTDRFSFKAYEIGERIESNCIPDSAFVRAEIISTNETFNQIRRAIVDQRIARKSLFDDSINAAAGR